MAIGQEDDETFGRRLQRLLKERAITARGAAKESGCPQSTLSGWLHGANPTNFHHVKRLAELLGVSLGYLLTGEVDQPLATAEVFEDGDTVLDGIVDVKIKKLVPRSKKGLHQEGE